MDILDVILFLQFFQTLMIIGLVFAFSTRTQRVTQHVDNVGVADQHESTYEEESIINERVFIRENEHDERIAQLMRELDPHDTPATPMHPGVKNLPHHTNIRELPDVEETE